MWKPWDDYRKDARETRAEVERIAAQTTAEAGRDAAGVVAEVAAGRPERVRETVKAYLTQLPNSIRAPRRRPQDPSGRSLSALLSLRRASSAHRRSIPVRARRPPRLARARGCALDSRAPSPFVTGTRAWPFSARSFTTQDVMLSFCMVAPEGAGPPVYDALGLM
jgi:hypothetical protein